MNRDPYGRGDNADADPYYARRPMADHPGRFVSHPQHESDGDPDHGPFFDTSAEGYGLDPGDFGYAYGGVDEADSYWASLGTYESEYVGTPDSPRDGTPRHGRPGDEGNGPGITAVYGRDDPVSGRRDRDAGYGATRRGSAGYGTGSYGSVGRSASDYGTGSYGAVGQGTGSHSTGSYGTGSYGAVGRGGDTAGYASVRNSRDTGSRRGYSRSDTGAYSRVGQGTSRNDYSRHRRTPDPERRSRTIAEVMPLWQELPLLLIVAFCLAVLIRTFLLQAFYIPSGSMEDTLPIGNRVLVNKIIYDVREPQRGEIVVFKGTDKWASETVSEENSSFIGRLGNTLGDLIGVSEPGETDFIKRVIGLPGDTVACCDAEGRVTVNGYSLDEPYVTDNSSVDIAPSATECRSRRFDPVVVEEGQMFVMGDHRAVSQDSRCQGTVPIVNVIGRAFVVVWPTDDWKGLSIPDTFEKVPRPLALGDLSDSVSSERGQTIAAKTWPVVPSAIDCFVPFVWRLSHRRVRRVRVRSHDVGSSP